MDALRIGRVQYGRENHVIRYLGGLMALLDGMHTQRPEKSTAGHLGRLSGQSVGNGKGVRHG